MRTREVTRDEWFRLFDSRLARWRAFGLRESLSAWWEGSRITYWLGLPWRCKFRHVPVEQHDIEPNTGYLYETWFDCARCGNFLRRGEFYG